MTSIGEYAFGNCSNLASITIPTNVTSIGDDAFYFCNSLTAINVSKENVNYTSENGILYDKNKRTLIQCPGGKTGELIIPGSVECLGETAFMGCDVLNSITMPDSVERIGKNTFGHCYGLTAINVSEKNPTYTSENGIFDTMPRWKSRRINYTRQCGIHRRICCFEVPCFNRYHNTSQCAKYRRFCILLQ